MSGPYNAVTTDWTTKCLTTKLPNINTITTTSAICWTAPLRRAAKSARRCWASDGKDEGAFDEAADCGFKSGAEHAGGVLGGGRFAIFFPGELHKPSCKSEGCDHVRKAVVKILMK